MLLSILPCVLIMPHITASLSTKTTQIFISHCKNGLITCTQLCLPGHGRCTYIRAGLGLKFFYKHLSISMLFPSSINEWPGWAVLTHHTAVPVDTLGKG